MIVHVTQRHIDEAIEWKSNRRIGQFLCENCPIGRAANEVLIPCGYNGIQLDFFTPQDTTFASENIGEEAVKFGQSFDNNMEISPFSFEVPDKYAKSPV